MRTYHIYLGEDLVTILPERRSEERVPRGQEEDAALKWLISLMGNYIAKSLDIRIIVELTS